MRACFVRLRGLRAFEVIVCFRGGRYNHFMRMERRGHRGGRELLVNTVPPLRSLRSRLGVAIALWIALALVVWNVVFDRVLVVAGRQYVYAATRAARGSGPYVRVDDWMRPAVSRATRTASGSAAIILTIGAVTCAVAARRSRGNVKSQVSSLTSDV